MAIVPAAGYPDANRSHFESMAVWHTADPTRSDPKGWLGHYLDHLARGTTPDALSAVNIGREVPQALVTDGPPVASIERLEDFGLSFDDRTGFDKGLEEEIIKQLVADAAQTDDPKLSYFGRQANNAIVSSAEIQAAADQYEPDADYPGGGLGEQLKLIARLIAGDFGTRVFYAQIGGFDTHANQLRGHEDLLRKVGDAVAAFHKDLKVKGLGSKVNTLVFSEFGRRVRQNDAQGTDHGAAGPLFVAGERVRGGFHGPPRPARPRQARPGRSDLPDRLPPGLRDPARRLAQRRQLQGPARQVRSGRPAGLSGGAGYIHAWGRLTRRPPPTTIRPPATRRPCRARSTSSSGCPAAARPT